MAEDETFTAGELNGPSWLGPASQSVRETKPAMAGIGVIPAGEY